MSTIAIGSPQQSITSNKLGLRLRFFRDLAYQFAPNNRKGTGDVSAFWTVLGSLDYLIPFPLSTLEDLSANTDPPNVYRLAGRCVGVASELLLIPLIDGIHASFDEAVEHLKIRDFLCEQRSGSQCPLLAIIRISLSSVAYDLPKGALQGVELLRAAESVIRENLRKLDQEENNKWLQNNVTIWTTLGGPDLVCLVAPKSPEEIARITALLVAIREARLPDLLISIPLRFQAPDAHAFAMVQATLCLGPDEELARHITTQEFINAETAANLRYPCRITVDPGHEQLLIRRLARRLSLGSAKLRSITTWGYRSVLLEFQHLSHLTNALQLLSEDAPGLKVPDISACRTTVGVWSENVGSASSEDLRAIHPGLDLDASLMKQMKRIGESFDSFSNILLSNGTLGFRLRQVFTNLESALHRNDRAVAIRDVLPFIDQLARCFEEVDVWKQFTSDGRGDASMKIVNQFSMLLTHLWQALRNRIEHRAEPLDPTFPNTLDYGASKLVNAYTVAVWTASELLTRVSKNRPLAESKSACGSEYFGACVSVSIEGRVWCIEAFSEIRRKQQEKSGLLALRESEKWNFPLLLLTISGPVLFHPELAFVHCLHEVAEFSRWFELPSAQPVRAAILKFANCAFSAMIASLVRQDRASKSQEVRLSTASIASDVSWICLVGLAKDRVSSRFDGAQVKKLASLSFANKSPRTVFEPFWTGFVHARQSNLLFAAGVQFAKDKTSKIDTQVNSAHHITTPDWFHNARNIYPDTSVTLVSPNSQVVSKQSLEATLAEWGSLLNEVVADTAMISALRYMLRHEGSALRGEHLSIDIARVFVSVIHSIVVYMPDLARKHAVDLAVARWYVQFRCHAGSCAEFADSLRRNERNIRNVYDSFSADEWLKARLQHTAVDPNESQSPDLLSMLVKHLRPAVEALQSSSTFCEYRNDEVCNKLIGDFADLWHSTRDTEYSGKADRDRLAFIHMLWIKATRFFSSDLIAEQK